MQATKYHCLNIHYRLGEPIEVFFFKLQQGRHQAVAGSSNTDINRSTEKSPQTDAQNLLERAPIICCGLLLLAAWRFGEVECCANPCIPK